MTIIPPSPDIARQKSIWNILVFSHMKGLVKGGFFFLFALITFGLYFTSEAQNLAGSPLNVDSIVEAYPNLKQIFDGVSFEGWEADPSTWTIAEGAMIGKGGSSHLVYTKKDYGSFRIIFTSGMGVVNDDHLGFMFWGDRPTDPANPKTDNAGCMQFAPPIDWMWDYHPLKGHTPDFERIAEGSKDFTRWSTTEVLCNLEKGTIRAAVNGVELLRYVHPFPAERADPKNRIISSLVCMMRHGGGTSMYKDIYMEENPKEDELLTNAKIK